MADLQTILRDPDFRAATRETQREILAGNDADFAGSSRATQDDILGSLGPAAASPGFGGMLKRELSRALTVTDIARGGSFSEETFRAAEAATGSVEDLNRRFAGAGQFVGSTVGAVAGQKIAGRPGAVIGAGAGGAAGRLADVYRTYLRGEPIPADLLKDALKAAGISMAFEAGGQAVMFGAGKALGVTPRPDASEVLRAFRETGVTPKVTDITASRGPAVMERAVAQTVTGQAGISERVAMQARQLSAAADDYFLARLGPQEATSGVATGLKVQQAVKASVERSKGLENRLFAEVERLGSDVKVPLGPAQAGARDLLDKEMLRPAAQRNGTLIATLKEILDVGKAKSVDTGLVDLSGKPIVRVVPGVAEVPLKKARVWAQTFGRAVERGELISKTPTAEAKFMFASMMDAIDAAIAGSGKADLQGAFTAARQFATLRREVYVDSAVSRVLQTAPEDVVKAIDAAGGPTAIRRVKEALVGPGSAAAPDPRAVEAWNYIRRHVFEGVFGRAKDEQAKGIFGPILSGARLEREVKRLGPESLKELLNDTEQTALSNVVTVAKAIRAGETLASAAQSTTAQQVEAKALLTLPGAVIGGAAGAVIGGPTTGAAAGMAVGSTLSLFFTAPAMAKLLTSERAVAVLASPGFSRLAMDLRLGGKLSEQAALALERLGAAFVTDAVSENQGPVVP